MRVTLDPMSRDDWPAVRAIYGEGLAAFTNTPPQWETWDTGHLTLGRLVARTPDLSVAGFAALSPVPDT